MKIALIAHDKKKSEITVRSGLGARGKLRATCLFSSPSLANPGGMWYDERKR